MYELIFFYLHSNISWKLKVFEKVFEILSNVFVFKYICI